MAAKLTGQDPEVTQNAVLMPNTGTTDEPGEWREPEKPQQQESWAPPLEREQPQPAGSSDQLDAVKIAGFEESLTVNFDADAAAEFRALMEDEGLTADEAFAQVTTQRAL